MEPEHVIKIGEVYEFGCQAGHYGTGESMSCNLFKLSDEKFAEQAKEFFGDYPLIITSREELDKVLSRVDVFVNLAVMEIHEVKIDTKDVFEGLSKFPALSQILFKDCDIPKIEFLEKYFYEVEHNFQQFWWHKKPQQDIKPQRKCVLQ
jgi:hypothetical protein